MHDNFSALIVKAKNVINSIALLVILAYADAKGSLSVKIFWLQLENLHLNFLTIIVIFLEKPSKDPSESFLVYFECLLFDIVPQRGQQLPSEVLSAVI